ncbi:MAG TPA: NUDIX hydrolase [Pseudolabrys sp.]|nr:NUDIX hydrolase [Pseudolabrys sp.]
MSRYDELADRAVEAIVSPPQLLAGGYREYCRFDLTLRGGNGAPVAQQRDVLLGGKVVVVMPIDLAHEQIVMVRQFRLSAHIANGRGDLIEFVAGRVEENESISDAAQRECVEEIGIAPGKLIEVLTYLPTPGLTDEQITLFLAKIDASPLREGARVTPDGERLHVVRAHVDHAIEALARGAVHSGPTVLGLQWLALNRGRLVELLG